MHELEYSLKNRKFIELFTEKEISELFPWELPSNPIWRDWENFVMTWSLSRKSEKTIANVWSALRLLVTELKLTSIESWYDADTLFKGYHVLERKRGWSGNTFNTYRKNANTYFRFLETRGIVSKSPTKSIQKMGEIKNNYFTPTTDEVTRLMDYEKGRNCVSEMVRARNLLYIAILSITGIRPIEALSINLSNFNGGRESFTIRGAKTSWKPRSFHLNGSLKEMLSNYIGLVNAAGRAQELKSYLFLSSRVGKQWSSDGIRKVFDKANENIGFSWKLTSYSFRRNTATTLYKNWIPLEKIAKMLGHTRLSTTSTYVQWFAEINDASVAVMDKVMAGIF